ncbi:hypothetical protein OG320_06470 [Microbispora sp. NBC_01189]|uniref:hypothetical protein n=1 Tax=Microbispora sp. NBC_01189 TaxID=2903583 RepID=UPI002E136069|nr:hypothetical protein OG320_06470 [Microbispora sp. NBC_01189]
MASLIQAGVMPNPINTSIESHVNIKHAISLATIASIFLVAGCSESPSAKDVYVVTEKDAREALNEVIAGVEERGLDRFCERSATGVDSCASALEDARNRCLYPGPPPEIKRSARVPPNGGRMDGWVLEVEGRTRDGQRYISEFFVMSDNGKARPHVAIYWTGLGLYQSPLGPNNTLLPKSACANQKGSTTSSWAIATVLDRLKDYGRIAL